ncbi:MAG: polysaccharide deacetylase family protein [Candidatus Saccharibacteria bacterium]|nr:polysaccharide deacetylase family protein [Rhodoferax sp.]
MIIKNVARLLSPGGRQARLSILIFHRVLPQVDALFPQEQDARRFTEVLSWVGRWFQVMPLDEAVRRLRDKTLPARAAAITFDDGYADNATHALPILLHHKMVATFFVASGFLDGGRMWNDSIIEAVRNCRGKVLDLRDVGHGIHPVESNEQQRTAIAALLNQIKYLDPARRHESVACIEEVSRVTLGEDLMMSSKQVVELHHAGMQIGAHTCTHPILTRLSDAQALDEIRGSKVALESLLGDPVRLFAYPNGQPEKDYRAQHARMVQTAGFIGAVSTAAGAAAMHTDMYQLPRFSPWDRSSVRYGVRMVANLLRCPVVAA